MRRMQDARVTPPIVLALATAAIVSAQSYPIRMSTPDHAGQRYMFTGAGSKVSKTSAGDRVMNSEDYQVSFEGRAEILEVDKGGRAVKIAFTVQRFTKAADGATVDLLEVGSVILADGSQKKPFSLKGGTLDEAAQEAFGAVYPAHKPNDVSDDDVFGTRELKRIGDSWPIHPEKAYESMKETGFSIPEGHLSGTVRLVAKDRIASTDCLSIRGELLADAIAAELPNGVTLERGNMQGVFRGCFPLDGSGLSRKEGADITVQMRVASKDGTKFDVIFSQKSDDIWVAVDK